MDDVKMEEDTSSVSSEEGYPSEDQLIEKVQASADRSLWSSYIALARKLGYLNLLRECRNAMALSEPQSEAFWCDWIDEEEKLCCDNDDMKTALDVCRWALLDIPAVSVCERFLRLSCRVENPSDVHQKFRCALGTAINNFSEGIRLWDIYFAKLVKEGNSDVALQAFKEQMSVPLRGFGETEFERRLRDLSISQPSESYKSLLKMFAQNQIEVSRRVTFDDKLRTARESDLILAAKEFADFEISCGRLDLAAARLEQAVQLSPDSSDLWERYIFLLAYNPVCETSFVNQTLERALRNVPSSTSLWLEKAKHYERLQCPMVDVKAIYNSALNNRLAGPEDCKRIWTEYLWFLRRHSDFDSAGSCPVALELRESFPKAIDQLYKCFGDGVDPDCSLERCWAYVEAKYFKDVARARSIWQENIFRFDNHNNPNLWKQYIQFERQFGNDKHIRKAILKALGSVEEDVDEFCKIAIENELANGTLEQLDNVVRLINTIRPSCDAQPRRRKRKFAERETGAPAGTLQPKVKLDSDRSNTHGMVSPPPKLTQVAVTDPTANSTEDTSVTPTCAVFLSNLSFDCTEGVLTSFFEEKVGDLKSISIMKNRKGQSRGFGHAEFHSETSAEKALLFDRSEINGRPMFISRYKPKLINGCSESEAKFKYSTGLERTKLFVKNLSKQTGSKDLTDLFEKYGKLKDVRIVKYRNGHSKGIAYIEFETESQARAALLETDGMEVQGSAISVAISNPPERRRPKNQNERRQHLQIFDASHRTQANGDTTSRSQLSNDDFRRLAFSGT